MLAAVVDIDDKIVARKQMLVRVLEGKIDLPVAATFEVDARLADVGSPRVAADDVGDGGQLLGDGHAPTPPSAMANPFFWRARSVVEIVLSWTTMPSGAKFSASSVIGLICQE